MDDDLEARNATRQAHLAERKAQERAARREALKALEGQQGVVIRWVCPAHDQPQVLYVAGRYTFEGAPAEVWHQIGKRPVFEDGVAAPDGHRNRRMDCPSKAVAPQRAGGWTRSSSWSTSCTTSPQSLTARGRVGP